MSDDEDKSKFAGWVAVPATGPTAPIQKVKAVVVRKRAQEERARAKAAAAEEEERALIAAARAKRAEKFGEGVAPQPMPADLPVMMPPLVPMTPPPPPPADDDKLQAAAIAKIIEQIQEARRDPKAFIEFAMRTPTGQPIKLAWFHREWLDSMMSHSRVIIEAPRGHGKTSITIGFALWLLGNNPNLRIKFICQNEEKAKERLYEFRMNLETNPAVKLVFPDLKQAEVGEWTKTKLYVERTAKTRDPSFEAVGINTSVTGGRIDVLFGDDICDMRNAIMYPTLRESIKQKFHGEILPTLEIDGRVIYICTPYHTNDLSAVIKANPIWLYKHYQVGDETDPFKPLWPEHWTRKLLVDKRAEVGSVEFDRAYRCLALTGATVPFRAAWLKFYTAEDLGDPHRLVCIIGYDLAISQKTSADYFACVVLLYDPDRHYIFIVDAYQDKLTFAEQGQRIVHDALKWRPDKIIIERVGLGGGLQSYLEEKSPIPLPLIPYYPKGDKEFRLRQQTPIFEDGRGFFHPMMHPEMNPLVGDRGDLITQLLQFPLGTKDDLVDALVTACSGLAEFRMGMDEEGWVDGENTHVRLSVIG